MTFPLPSSSVVSVTSSQAFWNLHTKIESSGDIYESDVAGLAFAIGPDSDVAQVKVSYFDPNEADKLNEQIVSVDRPFVGRIEPNLNERYATGQLGRMFISLLDVIPTTGFIPPSGATNQSVQIAPAVVDLIQYTTTEPNILSGRPDKVFRYDTTGEQASWPFATNPFWFIIPFYGRRFAQVVVKNLNFAAEPNIGVTTFGLTFSRVLAVPGIYPDNGNGEQQIDNTAALTPGSTAVHTVSNKVFDAIGVRITPAAALISPASVNTTVTVSDKI
jgi:hypothetical protein